jgi:hypothetical protein
MAEPDPDPAGARAKVDRGLTLIVLVLVAYRLAYHATYLGEVPFAHATFSDGAVYEQAARDILAHPPLGREPFYLQGAYAYFLALGMAIKAWPSLALLLQLLLAFASLWLFQRTAIRLWGRTAGLLASIALLGHPILAFYENKYLSAELGIAFNVATFAAFVAVLERKPERRTLAALGVGLGSGLAVLARPNMILALPFSLLALVALTRGGGADWPARTRAALRPCAALVLGLGLALAPMAARNLVVTGHPDVQPVHGGGTSFFIGNNPKARGVWNDGGLLSARLGTESLELAIALDIDPSLDDRERARVIGKALYARSLAWMRANPGDWAVLELRKLWLVIGDEPLTQDYDWLGERELLPWAHRIGVSFSVLLALALLGAGASLRERSRLPELGPLAATPAHRRALAWFIAGQLVGPLAANLLFFTSAQHRLPLAIPLALLAGPGALVVVAVIRDWRAGQRRPLAARMGIGWVIVAVLLLIQGPWPRSRSRAPSPVHYYNLAMVQDAIGEPVTALRSLDHALTLRPEQPIFLLRRAHLRYRLLDLDGAEADLAAIAAIAAREPVPAWLLTNAKDEAESIASARRLGTLPAARAPAPRPL